MTDHEASSADWARELIRTAVFTLVRKSGGQITRRPVITDPAYAGWTENEAEPLAGIAAAKHLEWAAARTVRKHAKNAREDGLSWQQIGEAIGLADDPQSGMTSIAEHAFQRLASDLGSGSSFGFTCGTCGKVIIDYGPEMGHPEDAERGHAEGCARMAEAIRAYRAGWDDDGETGEDGD
jgi:hypothetical protein